MQKQVRPQKSRTRLQQTCMQNLTRMKKIRILAVRTRRAMGRPSQAWILTILFKSQKVYALDESASFRQKSEKDRQRLT